MNNTTDVDSGKRKASQDQPDGLKDPKQRKKNSQVLSVNRNTSNTIEKLVSFWTAGGNIHPLLTQEVNIFYQVLVYLLLIKLYKLPGN